MKIVFTKLTEKGYEDVEYIVRAVKYGRGNIAIDIVGEGWRMLTKEQFVMFYIEE